MSISFFFSLPQASRYGEFGNMLFFPLACCENFGVNWLANQKHPNPVSFALWGYILEK
jgi:hypothetical protein